MFKVGTLFLSTLCLTVFPALADESAEIDAALSITQKECQKLMKLNDMSGADYVPGVDVRGNPVEGVNHGTPQMVPPKEVVFSLGIDLAKRYGLGDDINASFVYGEIKVKGRHVYFNDKRLGSDVTDTALAACREEYQ